jgi:hypothetical protein
MDILDALREHAHDGHVPILAGRPTPDEQPETASPGGPSSASSPVDDLDKVLA